MAAGLLLGARTEAKPMPDVQLEAGTQDGVIYVVRTNDNGWVIRGATVEVDGMVVANLPYNGCTAVRVPAGGHSVRVVWKSNPLYLEFSDRPSEFNTVVEPGGRSYLHFQVRSNTYGYGTTMTVQTWWNLFATDEASARRLFANCFYVKHRRDWVAQPGRTDLTPGPAGSSASEATPEPPPSDHPNTPATKESMPFKPGKGPDDERRGGG